MAEKKERVYADADAEVEQQVRAHKLDGWYLEDGWLRHKYNTDG